MVCALWSWLAGAAEGAAVRVACALSSWPLVPLGCCSRVLLLVRSGAGMLVLLQGAGAGYYCQRAVCILGTAVRVLCAL